METAIVYWAYIGVMEKTMDTTIVYWGYTGIMEKWKLLYWVIGGLEHAEAPGGGSFEL